MSDVQHASTVRPTTIAHRAVRLTLLVGLIWLGVTTAQSIKTLLSPPLDARAQFPSIDNTINLLPMEGAWRFDDLQTTIGTSITDDPNIEAASDSEEKTLAIDEPTLKAFLETDENADLLSATLSMQVDDHWRVLKLGNSVAKQVTPHLLPLNASKRVCGRWSNDDRLLLEIVSVDASRTDLLDKWKRAGWEIRHTAWGDLDSFSFLCAKGGQVVYAWSQQSDHITSLLLSRSPDVALRQTKSNRGENS